MTVVNGTSPLAKENSITYVLDLDAKDIETGTIQRTKSAEIIVITHEDTSEPIPNEIFNSFASDILKYREHQTTTAFNLKFKTKDYSLEFAMYERVSRTEISNLIKYVSRTEWRIK